LSDGSALAVGDAMTAAAHKPTSSDLHKRECWAIGNPAFVGSWTEDTRRTSPNAVNYGWDHNLD
jgi:hypothetical protein